MIAASPNCRSRSISRTRLLVVLREVRGEVRGEHGLAGAALRREHRHDPATRSIGVVRRCRRPGRRSRVPCESRTRSSRASCGSTRTSSTPALKAVSTRSGRASGTSEHDRRLRVQADHSHVGLEHGRDGIPVAAGSEQHGADVVRREVRHRIADLGRPADDFETAAGASSASCSSDSPSNDPVTTTRSVSRRLLVA